MQIFKYPQSRKKSVPHPPTQSPNLNKYPGFAAFALFFCFFFSFLWKYFKAVFMEGLFNPTYFYLRLWITRIVSNNTINTYDTVKDAFWCCWMPHWQSSIPCRLGCPVLQLISVRLGLNKVGKGFLNLELCLPSCPWLFLPASDLKKAPCAG